MGFFMVFLCLFQQKCVLAQSGRGYQKDLNTHFILHKITKLLVFKRYPEVQS